MPYSSSSDVSTLSLASNLSIQTLPSVPSLQKLNPLENLNLSISYQSAHSLNHVPKVPITCLAVHGTFLYAASSSSINVYDSTTLALLDSFNGPENPSSGSVKSVAFFNGKVLTAHQDSKIRTWKILKPPLKQHKLIAVLPTVNDRLRRLILPKNYVTVRRHKKKLWIEHSDAVTGIAVNERLNLIYSVSWDKTLKTWDATASDYRCLESVNAHEDAVNAIAVSVDGIVYTGSADCKIRVWGREIYCSQNKKNNKSRHVLVDTLEKHKSAVNALALNGDGSVLFSAACDRSILVWEREDSANYMVVTGALRGHGKAILCLVNVSGLLLSGSADRTVRIWTRGMDGRFCCLGVLDGHRKPVKSLTGIWEEDGLGRSDGVVSVFSGSLDGEIKAWRVEVSSTDV